MTEVLLAAAWGFAMGVLMTVLILYTVATGWPDAVTKIEPPRTNENPKPFSINWCIRSVRAGLRSWRGNYPPIKSQNSPVAMTPDRLASLEKLFATDASKIFEAVDLDAVVASVVDHPIRPVKRKP